MTAQNPSNEDRTRRRVAAAYRTQGYSVVAAPTADVLPKFLLDCHPAVIAERDDDRVVVEIKRAGSLKGANELVDLAQRVTAQPGWRLELITYKDKDPDAALISPQWLQQTLEPSNKALTCAYRLEVLGFLLRSLALRSDKSVRNKTPTAIARELAFEGIIDGHLVDRIDDAYHWQADLLRGHLSSPAAAEQAAALNQSAAAFSHRHNEPRTE
jgi:hypothetical protein